MFESFSPQGLLKNIWKSQKNIFYFSTFCIICFIWNYLLHTNMNGRNIIYFQTNLAVKILKDKEKSSICTTFCWTYGASLQGHQNLLSWLLFIKVYQTTYDECLCNQENPKEETFIAPRKLLYGVTWGVIGGLSQQKVNKTVIQYMKWCIPQSKSLKAAPFKYL